MKYGYFDNEKHEYIITNPHTPVKWINYVGTLDFGGLVDHTGGMLLCRKDPALNRITKYIPQMPASDFKGSTIYMRIKGQEGYKIFSPFYVPVLAPFDSYACHIGLGYTTIITQYYGLKTSVTFFAPDDNDCVTIDIRITNTTDKGIQLDVIPVFEYTHPVAEKQFNNADWVPQTMQSRLAVRKNKIIFQYPFYAKETSINWVTSNYPISSFETDRKIFLGNHEYGTWAHPLSLENEELSNYEALRGNNICAIMHHMNEIKPGETKRMITMIGQSKDDDTAALLIEKYSQETEVDAAFVRLKENWNNFLSYMWVETPSPSMNSMLNVFNPYQCFTTFNWSRFLSLYQLGLGVRGIGFRDSSQDVLGVLDRIPEKGKELIKKLLMVQLPDGSAMHSFYPLTMQGSVGEAKDNPDSPDYYGDDHLWIMLSITSYLKETGNMAFLDEEVPFYAEKGKTKEPGTVFEHMKRALKFTKTNVGSHNLPLLGFADWNDTVNLATGAESMFIANLYGKALQEMIALCSHLGKQELADQYKGWYEEMKEHFNKHSWDGEWFIRYFDEKGEPIGSKVNEQGKIYTNGQSWPVISGFASTEKALTALESVNKHLNTSKGIKLSTPGYNRYEKEKGGVTTYPPGAKENGGIFLHSNPWVMIAETMMGNGDRAFEYYNQINPASRNDIIDEFECEPYVYPQNILGDEHPQFGLARNSWLSGTASWTYQAGTKYILGIHPAFSGLMIDPCIPKSWDGFKVRRKFRGTIYNISVENPNHVSKGIKSITMDGVPVTGNILPLKKDAKAHDIKVVMG